MMDLEQRRKRKRARAVRPYSPTQHFSPRSFFICFSFFLFLFFLSSNRFPFVPSSFHPVLSSSTLSLFSSTATHSFLDSFQSQWLPLRVEDRVVFPDHVLLMLPSKLHRDLVLDCVYYKLIRGFSSDDQVKYDHIHVKPAFSTDDYDDFRSIVRCSTPPLNYSTATVDLRHHGDVAATRNSNLRANQTTGSWDNVVYEAALDGDTVVVFVKGLNLRPHKMYDPKQFRCHFGLKNRDKGRGFFITKQAVAAAQEVVRCMLPKSFRNNPEKGEGVRVTVSHTSVHSKAQAKNKLMPSVARIHNSSPQKLNKNEGKYELCACTMVWNQASALREWIMYHGWLGVQRWFIYDNNSNDEIEKVIEDLDLEGYNVSRKSWPWIKTQEAGFSHCALRARRECNWVGFFDVDEFFYFPSSLPGENSLQALVANFSSSTTIAEIRTACHSFGPSGLSSPPKQGVTVGYTCRLQSPERHKSIVRPDLLDSTLLNVVHHFQLKEGFKYFNVLESTALINHYKYQVWETFRFKFFRRVATYVVDWQEDQNKGSKDRAPGLGTEAIEPPNWRLKFCEVWDTGLKDFILSYFVDPLTGLLPWERSE